MRARDLLKPLVGIPMRTGQADPGPGGPPTEAPPKPRGTGLLEHVPLEVAGGPDSYPVEVQVFLAGTLLDEGTFQNVVTARDFIVATYRRVATYGREDRELRIRYTVHLPAAEAVTDEALSALHRLQHGGRR